MNLNLVYKVLFRNENLVLNNLSDSSVILVMGTMGEIDLGPLCRWNRFPGPASSEGSIMAFVSHTEDDTTRPSSKYNHAKTTADMLLRKAVANRLRESIEMSE